MPGISRDEHDPETFHVDWAAVHGGLNPWKRTEKVVVDPFLVAKAVKAVMRQCPHQTATGKPLVWNDYAVFLDLNDWERIKKLESTLAARPGRGGREAPQEAEGGDGRRRSTCACCATRAAPCAPATRSSRWTSRRWTPAWRTDPSEMTVRIGGPVAKSLTDLTQRVPESFVGA